MQRKEGTFADSGNPRFSSDRKSTRLNSSHGYISYAVFCLKKKNKPQREIRRVLRCGCHVRVEGLVQKENLHRLRLGELLAFFFFNDTATTEIYTLSLHDALPI